MKFSVEIDLGNDAMRSELDLADALARIAKQIKFYSACHIATDGKVKDVNGNTVGRWKTE